MACDMFSVNNTNELLRGKFIYVFGGSNVRAIYKDLLWLLEDGTLIPLERLKLKNEESHANDIRVSNGLLHSGRDYEEEREYYGNATIKFQFITRLLRSAFVNTVKNFNKDPDIIIINSCVWDLTRWGADGVQQYKNNIRETFRFLRCYLPSSRIIWVSTLPTSFRSRGGFLTKDTELMRNMLPWHIHFANEYMVDVATSFSIDVLDLHYHFRFLRNFHDKDGIHWLPIAVRYITNLLLTHIALVWNYQLPRRFPLDTNFLAKCKLKFIQDVNSESKQKLLTRNSRVLGDISNWSNACPKNNVTKRNSRRRSRKNRRLKRRQLQSNMNYVINCSENFKHIPFNNFKQLLR